MIKLGHPSLPGYLYFRDYTIKEFLHYFENYLNEIEVNIFGNLYKFPTEECEIYEIIATKIYP